MAAHDLNGDRLLDLAVLVPAARSTGHILEFLGKGDGDFELRRVIEEPGYEARSLVVADLNDDGEPDIVVANGGDPFAIHRELNGSLAVLQGQGGGDFTFRGTFSVGRYDLFGLDDLVAADFNGDDRVDVAVVTFGGPRCLLCSEPLESSVSVLLGNGDGTLQPSVDYDIADARRIAADDLDGDGRIDLVAATRTGLRVLLNTCGVD